MNWIFMMLIAIGQMESKVGIPSFWDIGTCKQKLVSEYLFYIFWKFCLQCHPLDKRKVFFKLRLIFFNHINNVIDVYIQSSKRFFFDWYYCTCLRMHAMGAECLCEYVAMTRFIVIPAPLWRVNMSLHVSKH
jgi:hypothetical protein